MNLRPLFNIETKLKFIKEISSIEIALKFIKRETYLLKIKSKLNSMDFNILKISSVIRNPIIDIFNISGPIKELKLDSILEVFGYINYEFKLNKEDYIDYSKLIYDNIDDLAKRIRYLFYFVKNYLINSGADYLDETYMLTEEKFKFILTALDTEKYNSYQEITDRILIDEIIKYLRSNV